MKLQNLFKSKTPTSAEVEAEITALADKRAGLQRDLDTLQADMITAYGDDAQTDTLALKIASCEAQLRNMASVSSELESERQAAVLRQIVVDVRTGYADMEANVKRVVELNPAVADAFATLESLVIESNTLRNDIARQRNGEWTGLRQALTAAGLDPAQHFETLKQQAEHMRSDYPDAHKALALNVKEAQAAARLGFAAPDSGLKVAGHD